MPSLPYFLTIVRKSHERGRGREQSLFYVFTHLKMASYAKQAGLKLTEIYLAPSLTLDV